MCGGRSIDMAIDRLGDTQQRGDFRAVAAMYLPTGMLVDGKHSFRGPSAIQQHLEARGNIAISDVDTTIDSVRTVGKTVYADGSIDFRATLGGLLTMPHSSTFASRWQCVARRWRIVRLELH